VIPITLGDLAIVNAGRRTLELVLNMLGLYEPGPGDEPRKHYYWLVCGEREKTDKKVDRGSFDTHTKSFLTTSLGSRKY
jgi:hypothetical protein